MSKPQIPPNKGSSSYGVQEQALPPRSDSGQDQRMDAAEKNITLAATCGFFFGMGATVASMALPQAYPRWPVASWQLMFWGGLATMFCCAVVAGYEIGLRPRLRGRGNRVALTIMALCAVGFFAAGAWFIIDRAPVAKPPALTTFARAAPSVAGTPVTKGGPTSAGPPVPTEPPRRQALFEGDGMSLRGNQVVGTTPPLFRGNNSVVHDNMFFGPAAARGAVRDAEMRGPTASPEENREADVRETLLREITAQYLREHPKVGPPDDHYLAPNNYLNDELARRGQPWAVMVSSTDSYRTYPWHDQSYTRR